MKVIIRTMTAADVDTIYAIEVASHITPWSRQIFEQSLAADFINFVLEVDDCIVGFAMMQIAAAEAHILNIAVMPEQQRHGYGSLLLNNVMDIARDQQVQRLFLEVRPSNQAALALYQHFGFEVISKRPNYYQNGDGEIEDAIVFQYVFHQAGTT